MNTFIVTNANDCPNLLSHGAAFRMGVLLPNYLEENVVKGENVPNFKFNTSTSTTRRYIIIKCLPDPARSMTETVPGKMPFRFYAK